ncbi:hypothetical protein EC912_10914 [Luteibacter rhizovicinus]|uniref:Uncharacterized protein n=2 Tax=Luteibacter rhizovicinus TaxID=242606 RepID=A0A4R3YL56_9GAMM|nr:hypothetical protein EC912_10914 [Luteibacter rhizovicinus]
MARAQDRPTGDNAATSCTDVEIQGRRVPSYDCLSRLMAAPTRTGTSTAPLASEAQSAMSHRMGLYNDSALRQRMGTNFGRSVEPMRPTVSYPTPLVPALGGH